MSHKKVLGMGSAAAERALKVFSPAQMIETHAGFYMALFRPVNDIQSIKINWEEC